MEKYTIQLEVMYDSTKSKDLKNLLTAIDSRIRTNNKLITREYRYEMGYAWQGIVQLGRALVNINATRDLVSI